MDLSCHSRPRLAGFGRRDSLDRTAAPARSRRRITLNTRVRSEVAAAPCRRGQVAALIVTRCILARNKPSRGPIKGRGCSSQRGRLQPIWSRRDKRKAHPLPYTMSRFVALPILGEAIPNLVTHPA